MNGKTKISLITLFSLALSAPRGAQAEQATLNLQCAVQSVNAEKDGLEVVPGPGENGNVTLAQDHVSDSYVGAKSFLFPAVSGARARGYRVEIELRSEPDRSSWANGAPRLYLTFRARDAATSRLIAVHEDHSDKILNQSMVNDLRRSGPRVVFQMLLPEALAALEAIGSPAVVAARTKSLEEGFAAAVKAGFLLPREPYRFDVACFPTTR